MYEYLHNCLRCNPDRQKNRKLISCSRVSPFYEPEEQKVDLIVDNVDRFLDPEERKRISCSRVLPFCEQREQKVDLISGMILKSR